MQRLYRLKGEGVIYMFSSKAKTHEGVFRTLVKYHMGDLYRMELKIGNVYSLCPCDPVTLGFNDKDRVSAFWNGKAFVHLC